jgi:hypothetical protein
VFLLERFRPLVTDYKENNRVIRPIGVTPMAFYQPKVKELK